MNCKKLLTLLVILSSPMVAVAQDSDALLIKGATVLTVTNGTLENTDVLVEKGKIARIGSNLTARGARVIDASGQFLMPGIIDAHSHIALSSINEGSSPVTAEVTMEDVVDPFDVGIYRALAGGVTTSHLMHGSANVIGGQNETIKHRYGVRTPDGLRMAGAPRTIKFALGENPTRSHGSRGNQPSSRMGVEMVLRQTFTDGKRYMEAWDKYNADVKKNPRLVPPAYNLRLETIADILRGEVLVHCHSYRADEILMLLDVLGDFGVSKIVFQHTNEGFKVAPELADFGAMASVFADWWAYKFEVYYSTAYNAAILTKNGVTTSINSDSGELNRHLYHEAAKTQRYGGLSDDEALALITINPAKQLGVDDRIGSIDVGKDADLVLFDEHPLSVYAIPQITIVDGVVEFDRAADPDDIRIIVDPAEDIAETHINESNDRCMEGVADLDWLLGGEAAEFKGSSAGFSNAAGR